MAATRRVRGGVAAAALPSRKRHSRRANAANVGRKRGRLSGRRYDDAPEAAEQYAEGPSRPSFFSTEPIPEASPLRKDVALRDAPKKALAAYDNQKKTSKKSLDKPIVFHARTKGSGYGDAAKAEPAKRPARRPRFRRVAIPLMNRGDAAAATWIFYGDESRRRR